MHAGLQNGQSSFGCRQQSFLLGPSVGLDSFTIQVVPVQSCFMSVAFTPKPACSNFEHNVRQRKQRLNASIAVAKQEAIVDVMLLQARLSDEAERQEMLDAKAIFRQDTDGSLLVDTQLKTDATAVQQPRADEYSNAPVRRHHTAPANKQQEPIEFPAEQPEPSTTE